MIRNYYEVRDWLEGFFPLTHSRKELGLSRIKYLLDLLGNPQDKFKSIHVARTSGKGSTAFYIARLLQFAAIGSSAAIKKRSANLEINPRRLSPPRSGLRPHQTLKDNLDDDLSGLRHVFDWQQPSLSVSNVNGQMSNVKIGLHLSPHLVDLRERMQIFQCQVSNVKCQMSGEGLMPMRRFIALMSEIKPVVESMRGSKVGLPSYFEILVAASFLYFAQEKVDWAVVEVGLGGRLDATNVLRPKLCVITNVGLDHTDILGKTIEEIAYEKAGIIKRVRELESQRVKGIPVITGATGKALKVIGQVARQKNAPLIKVNTQLRVQPLKSDTKDYLIKYYDIVRHRPQNFVLENILLAISALEALGFAVTKSDLKKTLSVPFAGRLEQIDDGVIVDGAHNPDKIKFLIRWVRNYLETFRGYGNEARSVRGLRLTSPKTETGIVTDKRQTIILVVAFKKGKQWKKMIDLLIKNLPVKKVIATQFNAVTDMGQYQAVEPEEILDYVNGKYESVFFNRIKKGKMENGKSVGNSQEAVFEALNKSVILNESEGSRDSSSSTQNDKPLVLVTGSLYLVGEVRTLWYLPEF